MEWNATMHNDFFSVQHFESHVRVVQLWISFYFILKLYSHLFHFISCMWICWNFARTNEIVVFARQHSHCSNDNRSDRLLNSNTNQRTDKSQSNSTIVRLNLRVLTGWHKLFQCEIVKIATAKRFRAFDSLHN